MRPTNQSLVTNTPQITHTTREVWETNLDAQVHRENVQECFGVRNRERIQMSINRGRHTFAVVYSYNGILPSFIDFQDATECKVIDLRATKKERGCQRVYGTVLFL